MRLRSTVLGFAVALASSASAAPDHGAAQAHFAAAERAYREGQYQLAVAELRAGFALDPQPAYRVALAQAYLKNGQTRAALEQCQRYLASAADPTMRPVMRQLRERLRRKLGSEISDGSSADSGEPAEGGAGSAAEGAPERAATVTKPTTALLPPARAAAAPLQLAIPAPPTSSPPSWWSAHGRTAIAVIVSVAVAAGVAGVVAAVEANPSSSPTPTTTLGTLHF